MNSPSPIAVVQGAESAVIQALFRMIADDWGTGIRIVGLVEEPESDDGPAHLRSLGDGSRYALFQDLGPGASSCGLDPGEVVRAGEAVRRDIAAGCDLVILSKFGKLEAEERSGLLPAFAAAVEAGVPVLTSVAPRHGASWGRFADPLSTLLPPDIAAIAEWRAALLASGG